MSDTSRKIGFDEVQEYMIDEVQYLRDFNKYINELDIVAEKVTVIEDRQTQEAPSDCTKRAYKRFESCLIREITGSTDDENYKVAREHGLQVR